jgi:hypothetical protein
MNKEPLPVAAIPPFEHLPSNNNNETLNLLHDLNTISELDLGDINIDLLGDSNLDLFGDSNLDHFGDPNMNVTSNNNIVHFGLQS